LLKATDKTLFDDLKTLVESTTMGDPESPLLWTTQSLRSLAAHLRAMGHRIGHVTVGILLAEQGYSLQGNRKTLEGSAHPDRDAQFQFITERVRVTMEQGQPVVSVDTKKKELVGLYKNGGRSYRPKGDPVSVKVHDFVDKDLGKVAPYGIYDVTHNEAWVNVGTDHDTSAFAVESIRRWWLMMGQERYPDATRLMITADSGGSNGARVRLWKAELQKFANETGLEIHVSHFPPGTSKWNKIEHRLFSAISLNWRGRPLINHEVIINLIESTTTRTGLKVRAILDTNRYPKGIKVSDTELKALIPFLIQLCNNMLIPLEVSIWRERHVAEKCWRGRKSFCARLARFRSCARRRRWYCLWNTGSRWSVPAPLPAFPKDGQVVCERNSSVRRACITRKSSEAADGARI
jgi:hypothetical protein